MVESANIIWLIYGNKLYYSSGNTCYTEVPLLSYLMLAILIMGYFHMMLYAVILGVITFLCVVMFKDKSKKKHGSIVILKSL